MYDDGRCYLFGIGYHLPIERPWQMGLLGHLMVDSIVHRDGNCSLGLFKLQGLPGNEGRNEEINISLFFYFLPIL